MSEKLYTENSVRTLIRAMSHDGITKDAEEYFLSTLTTAPTDKGKVDSESAAKLGIAVVALENIAGKAWIFDELDSDWYRRVANKALAALGEVKP